MKRMLLAAAAVILFLNALAIPTVVRADGGGGSGQNCPPPEVCKPYQAR